MYRYTDNSMSLSGQIFFPILFALMSAYVTLRNPQRNRFSTVHLGLLALAVVGLVLTIAGAVGKLYYFYPSMLIYYLALGVLVLDLGLRIAAMPKAQKAEPVQKPKKKTAARSAHLVATVKSSPASGAATAEGKD